MMHRDSSQEVGLAPCNSSRLWRVELQDSAAKAEVEDGVNADFGDFLHDVS